VLIHCSLHDVLYFCSRVSSGEHMHCNLVSIVSSRTSSSWCKFCGLHTKLCLVALKISRSLTAVCMYLTTVYIVLLSAYFVALVWHFWSFSATSPACFYISVDCCFYRLVCRTNSKAIFFCFVYMKVVCIRMYNWMIIFVDIPSVSI